MSVGVKRAAASVFIGSVALAGIVAIVLLGGDQSASNAGEAASPPVALVERLAKFDLTLTAPSDSQVSFVDSEGLAPAAAVSRARTEIPGTREGAEIYIGLLTNNGRRVGDPNGDARFRNRLVYAIVFPDSELSVGGHQMINNPDGEPTPSAPRKVITDQIAFLDPVTGSFLLSFNF